jgi:hypothetical protein
MVSPQRTLRYPYNKVQGPPTIVGWTTVVSTTPAWGVEPTTSSVGAMSPYHQAQAVVPYNTLHNYQGWPVKQKVQGWFRILNICIGGGTKPGQHGSELLRCNEIRLCAKNIITVLDSTVNTIGKAYVTTEKEIGI